MLINALKQYMGMYFSNYFIILIYIVYEFYMEITIRKFLPKSLNFLLDEWIIKIFLNINSNSKYDKFAMYQS